MGGPLFVAPPEARTAPLEALLEVAATLNREAGISTGRAQARLIETQARLQREHGITQREFCKRLGIPDRTFRSWADRPPAPPPPPPPAPAPAPPPVDSNRGRFALEALLPEVQHMADTTDIRVFDVPLKLVAVQDPGGRDQSLWEAIQVSETETAAVVKEVVVAAAQGRAGLQLVTDQGRPYIAGEATRAYEAAELEHVPAPEGTPTAKATLERSFGTIKPLLAPLTTFTAQLAAAIPAFRNASLARLMGQFLISALLEAHRLGLASRVGATRPSDPELLRVLAAEERNRVRHEHLSRRQLLERLHEEYAMEGSRETFVRSLRHHAYDDIEEAERRFRRAVLRPREISRADRYFAGTVRNVFDKRQPEREAERQKLKERLRRRDEERLFHEEQRQLEAAPDGAVLKALKMLGITYQPKTNSLLMGGIGMGRVILRRAVTAIMTRDGTQAHDTLEMLWKQWAARSPRTDEQLIAAVRQLWDKILGDANATKTGFTVTPARSILYRPAPP